MTVNKVTDVQPETATSGEINSLKSSTVWPRFVQKYIQEDRKEKQEEFVATFLYSLIGIFHTAVRRPSFKEACGWCDWQLGFSRDKGITAHATKPMSENEKAQQKQIMPWYMVSIRGKDGKRGNQTAQERVTGRAAERKQKQHSLDLWAWEDQSSWWSQYAYWRPHKRTKKKRQDVFCSAPFFSFALPASFYFHSPFSLWRLSVCFWLSWGFQMCVLGEVEKIAPSNSQHLQLGLAQHGPAWSSVCSVAEFLLSYRAFIPSLSWHRARLKFSLLKRLNLHVWQEVMERADYTMNSGLMYWCVRVARYSHLGLTNNGDNSRVRVTSFAWNLIETAAPWKFNANSTMQWGLHGNHQNPVAKCVPTLTRPLIGEQLVALPAATLEASHCVAANLIAAAVAHAALVNIWNGNHSRALTMRRRRF